MDGHKQTRSLIHSLIIAMAAASLLVGGCSTHSVDDPVDNQSAAATDDFSDFDSNSVAKNDNFGGDDESAVESELNNKTTAAPSNSDEFAQFDEPKQEDPPPAIDPGGSNETIAQEPLPEQSPLPPEEPPAEVPPTEIPSSEPIAQQPPASEEPAMAEPTGQIVNIKSLQFRANDNGGTVVVEADGPMQFQPRMNPETNQYILEIPNSKLPAKLKRPLNTRDFAGKVGSIDAYQKKGSNTTHVVIQLRAHDGEPVVQAEGNSLLVVTSPAPPASEVIAQTPISTTPEEAAEEEPDVPSSKLMAVDNLEEFLANNQTFYGKKISLETDDADIRSVFKLISEEANVNLIVSDEVTGKVTVKLKNVPWDQALVLLLKTKKLGYTRSGNVLRIAPLADIQKEEKDSFDLLSQRKQNASPKVRTVQVNYAKVEDLANQVKGILSKAGTVVSDARTSSLIITDLDENIDRAVKVIQSIDVPPQQVAIEGKIVEAQNSAEESMGIQWGAGGVRTQIGQGKNTAKSSLGNIGLTPSLGLNPDMPNTNSLNFNLNMGTFDLLGDLSATLNMFEHDGKVKILSSPRIVTLHNEKASIEQILQLPIRQTTFSNGVGQTTISYKDTKLSLDVTPQLTNDGAVMMKIDMVREFPGEIDNIADGARSINSRKASTKVLVRNGQTAVIGGIYQNDTSESETRVPGLGRLPLIGWLFRSNTKSDKRNELLMFLTPRILGQLDSQVIPNKNGNESQGDGGLEL